MTGRQLATTFGLFAIVATLVLGFALPASYLTPVLFILTPLAWISVAIFIRPTLLRPRIGALTERAWIGFVIAMMGTVFCVLILNTDNGRPWFDLELAQRLSRLTILAVLLVPSTWLLLYVTGRLGQGDK